MQENTPRGCILSTNSGWHDFKKIQRLLLCGLSVAKRNHHPGHSESESQANETPRCGWDILSVSSGGELRFRELKRWLVSYRMMTVLLAGISRFYDFRKVETRTFRTGLHLQQKS